MKNEIQMFDPAIYPFKLWIIVAKDVSIVEKTFLQFDGKPMEHLKEDVANCEAFSMSVIHKEIHKCGAIIFFRSKKSMTYELVAHECCHAAKHLFEYIGADIKEHEPFEYVVGWMANCCERVKILSNINNK